MLWSRINKGNRSDCWPWTGAKNDKGYGQLSIQKRRKYAHRAVFELANGSIPDGMEVMHTCDNPACCNPLHLTLGTHAENMRDCWRKGRGKPGGLKGSAHPRAILSEANVRNIRKALKRGASKRGLAKHYGVSQGAIQGIARGTNWRSLR